MSIFYRKYQNKNKNQKTFGWWYGRAVTLGKTYTLTALGTTSCMGHGPIYL